MKPEEINGDLKATRAEIDELAQATKAAFDRLEKKVETLAAHESVARVEQRLNDTDAQIQAVRQLVEKSLRIEEAMLTTINSIDGRRKEVSDHTDRIIRLEDEVFAPRGNRLSR